MLSECQSYVRDRGVIRPDVTALYARFVTLSSQRLLNGNTHQVNYSARSQMTSASCIEFMNGVRVLIYVVANATTQ